MSISLLLQWLLGRGPLPPKNAFLSLAIVFVVITLVGIATWASTFVQRFIGSKTEKQARARLGTALGWLGAACAFFAFAWWQGVPYLGALILVVPCVLWMAYEGWIYCKNKKIIENHSVTSRYDRWLPRRKKS